MVKVIEQDYFRAEVDASDLDDVKITITMHKPLVTNEYSISDEKIRYERDLMSDAKAIAGEVDWYIAQEHRRRRRGYLAV